MKKPATNNQISIDIAVLSEKMDTVKFTVVKIEKKLDCMVPNDADYQELKMKVDNLWDSKNKMVGWLIGSGVVGGSISTLVQGIIKTVSAMVK